MKNKTITNDINTSRVRGQQNDDAFMDVQKAIRGNFGVPGEYFN